MTDDLGGRLVAAGLVTPDQLAEVRGAAPPHEGALVAALVERGLSEDAAAGFFVALGLGPLLEAADLAGAQPGALARLSASVACGLMALPVRASPAGLVVAMAAPTDRHAVAELCRVVEGEVLPAVARVSELLDALARAYPSGAPPRIATRPSSEPPVLELVHAHRKKELAAVEGYLGSTRGAERVEARALVGPRLAMEEDEPFVPLVRHKPLPAPQKPKVITKSFEKPSAGELAAARDAAAWAPTSSAPPPPPSTRPSASPKSIIPPEHASWDLDALDAPENKVDPVKMRALASPQKRPARPSPVGGTLAAIRASRERDEVVELACRGALTVCRAAVLLALRKGVLKGWDGAGAGVTRDVVRNLWIPTNSPSAFRDVVAHGEPYAGAHGTSAADGLFRAAVGSRGGTVVLMPVSVGGKVVAVLGADDVRYEREGVERLEILAHAIGEAFERIIVESKKR